MEYRAMPSLGNNFILLNSSKKHLNNDIKLNSSQIIQNSTGFNLPNCDNISKSKLGTLQNQSKCNPSLNAHKKIKNISLLTNLSHFHDQILESKQISQSNNNSPNPEKKLSLSNERKIYRSKTCQERKQPDTFILSSKMQTEHQRDDHLYSSATKKIYKSFNLNLKPEQVIKSQIDEPLSKVTSIKYQSKGEFLSHTYSFQKQFLSDKITKSQHEEFYKRLSGLINRNQEINVRYKKIETDYDKSNQEFKKMLQNELNDIQNTRQTMTKQFNQRIAKIISKTKTNFSKANPINRNCSSKQSRQQTLNKQSSIVK